MFFIQQHIDVWCNTDLRIICAKHKINFQYNMQLLYISIANECIITEQYHKFVQRNQQISLQKK